MHAPQPAARRADPSPDTGPLLVRIRAEYEDMPGLCLTLRQAARLWDLEPTECEHLMEALVAQGVLRQGRGGYLLARSRIHEC